ncbi:MAG TPA: (d)CMP kinase [Steroidobacteraceae bacterium]|nr:(d)CMP kinase [Steroidobacteraceae bacterium]
MSRAPVIAIDGPSGAGKGTVSRSVAQALGWFLLDSGALYRLVALQAREAGIELTDEAGLGGIAAELEPRFGATRSGGDVVRLRDRDVTLAIRTEQAGNDASKVAALPSVRRALLERQRRFAVPPGLVADGRDMGSVVFPDAELKIFLSASAEERAARRHKQLKEQGVTANLAALSLEIAERDRRDRTRAVSPLVASPDAVSIDTTGVPVETVVERILGIARERMKMV